MTKAGAVEAGGRDRLVDGVIFDVDDTLVDTARAFGHALEAACAGSLPGVGPAGLAEITSHWRADPGGHYSRYTRGELTFHEQRLVRANEVQERWGGLVLDDVGYQEWSARFDAAFADAWELLADVPDMLDALELAGVRLGVLTNAATEMQTRKLTRVGLVDRVPLLVAVDTLGVGKPDARVFLEACRRLGTDPSRTAYVGDELTVDALGAVAAGLRGIWVDRPGSRRHLIDETDVVAARAAGVEVLAGLDELPAALGLSGAVPRG